MTITCTTTEAAAQVTAILIDDELTPGRQFHTGISYLFGPPIIFTILVDLPSDLLRQLRTIPDTTIT
jgi:hypothetical protein